jgi:hypothetical protein
MNEQEFNKKEETTKKKQRKEKKRKKRDGQEFVRIFRKSTLRQSFKFPTRFKVEKTISL